MTSLSIAKPTARTAEARPANRRARVPSVPREIEEEDLEFLAMLIFAGALQHATDPWRPEAA